MRTRTHPHSTHSPFAHIYQCDSWGARLIRSLSTRAHSPLRDRNRTEPHPFPATIFFLADGIKKLRTVEADREQADRESRGQQASDAPTPNTAAAAGLAAQRRPLQRARTSGRFETTDMSIDLWRGMRNLQTADDFLMQGGSESACMSTTSELEVAIGYALSAHSLIFKIRTPSFMQRGADISWLSAFPAEKEFLVRESKMGDRPLNFSEVIK